VSTGEAPAFQAAGTARDKNGRPLVLRADLRAGSLVVRAFYRGRTRPLAVLLATLDGPEATLRDIGCFAPGALNKGVGTALLTFAEEVFRRHGVVRVTGALSAADADHRDRQVHFYLKNGYDVTLEPDRTGRITKSLAAAAPPPGTAPGRRPAL